MERKPVEQSLMWQALCRATSQIVTREADKGRVYSAGKRWDEKDQKDFESLPIERLLDDPYYMGVGKDLYPEHRLDILNLFARRKRRETTTAVFQEGIGSGKTFKYAACIWLLLVEVLTKVKPLQYYGMSAKSAGISFICMSRNARLAKDVTFQQILPFFSCPFLNEYFPPQLNYEKMEETKKFPSVLRFPKNIVVFPGTGSALSAIGYNLFGGGVDEANYLEVIDESKKAIQGRRYDAGEEMYNAIMSRMVSRFAPSRLLKQGKTPGILFLFSNTRYRGDFTSRLALRARRDPTIFYRRRCTWEGHPKSRYSGKTFLFNVSTRRIVEADKDGVV